MDRSKNDCRCTYDLIFLDCNMPDMDGFQTIVNIYKMVDMKKIPSLHIVGATADVTQQNIDKCIKYGFTDILSKPIRLTLELPFP